MGGIGAEQRELEKKKELKVKVEVDFKKEKFPEWGAVLIGQLALYKIKIEEWNLPMDVLSLIRREAMVIILI